VTNIPRVLPALDETNKDFWTSGLDGQLRICRCKDCGTWNQPPGPLCRNCLSSSVVGEPVSGRGTVLTYSVNRHQWGAEPTPPYVVAIVELPEQEGLRLTTNIVGIDPEQVRVGMAVEIEFEAIEDVAIPVFRPVA
jgi:uncharacterized protein